LGLILNELLTNTFKHNEDAASLLVSMEFIDCGGGKFELSYRDSGRNFVAPKRTDAIESTGWRLIWRLCEQLNGGLNQREGTIYLTFLNEQARKSIA
jgi:two-component sensor histidine kinase